MADQPERITVVGAAEARRSAASGEGASPYVPEVYALVGASGTGKSYQASLVAYEHDIDTVVDDGLLISGGRILAGCSAKAEATRVAAIKRAIFAHPEQAAETREALLRLAAPRLLVLGTSLEMIGRISVALGLPVPSRIMRIEDVTSPDEIRRARRIRRELGKHVVPAPTLEVRKTFSGYLIDPIRFFLRPKAGRGQDVVVEKSIVQPTWSRLGRFYINDVVLHSIALRAAREVDGVARAMRARVNPGPDGSLVHLDLALKYGAQVVQVCHAVQIHVKHVLEYMTALNVAAVHVVARTVILPEQGKPPATPGR